MTEKFTPGPWMAREGGEVWRVFAAEGIDEVERVHLVATLGRTPVDAADAHLIAAAPEMFDALQNFMGLFDNAVFRRKLSGDDFYPETIEAGRKALAKARGVA